MDTEKPMKCAWCQKETNDRYMKYKGRKKINGVILPLCQDHRDVVVGPEALPLADEKKTAPP